jgi:hypothetical protein
MKLEKVLLIILLVGSVATLTADAKKNGKKNNVGEFDEFSITFEVNEIDVDAEVVTRIKTDEGLKRLTVQDPSGKKILDVKAKDRQDLGQREFVLESAEPSVEDVIAAFPEGIYIFKAQTVTGMDLYGESTLSHDLLPAPAFTPEDGDLVDPNDDLYIEWSAVEGAKAYIIELEQDDLGVNLTLTVPSDILNFTIPQGFLVPDMEYQLGIGTLTEEGNFSVAEVNFETATEPPDEEFEDASLIVVYSVSDEDAQIIAQGGSEELISQVIITGPDNAVLHKVKFKDADELGQADFQFETPEPSLEDLMLAYPSGDYLFRGKTIFGDILANSVELSYELAPAPTITYPLEGDVGIPVNDLEVLFDPPAEAEAIRLEIEDEEEEVAIKVDLPGDATSFFVPNGWLQTGTEYVLDIKVIAENGNQTVRDIRFVTEE